MHQKKYSVGTKLRGCPELTEICSLQALLLHHGRRFQSLAGHNDNGEGYFCSVHLLHEVGAQSTLQ